MLRCDPNSRFHGNPWWWVACGQATLGLAAVLAAAPISEPQGSVRLLEERESGLSLLVTAPGFSVEVRENGAGRFSQFQIPDGGFLQAVGKPALPVIRRLIVVPENTGVAASWKGGATTHSLLALGLPLRVMPAQPSVAKIPGAVEAAGFVQDDVLYASATLYPASPVTLTEAGTLFGRRIMALEVCPFGTIPATGSLIVYSNLQVTVSFATPQARKVAIGLSAYEQALLRGVVLNPPPPGEALAAAGKRLLVIAPPNFTNGLVPFISHKTGRGWQVECFTTNVTGKTSAGIQAFIKGRYTNSATRPEALLLVGGSRQIPCFSGVSPAYPATDLYYGCMDGAADWQPEFPVGRFSVTTTGELAAVVAKTLAHEQAVLAPWIKRALFIASVDNHAVSEGTHNQVISEIMAPLGYDSGKLYCFSYGATAAQLKTRVNAGCVLGVYSGHGDVTYWSDGPEFRAHDVASLTNSCYPVICSFACLTGSLTDYQCFAETWLRAPARGGVAVLASSVNSLWTEDDILEKSLFKALFLEQQSGFGMALWRARQLYLSHFGPTSTTRNYFEQYNLFGDPSLEMAGLPMLTNGIPVAWFTSQGITNADYNLELGEDRDGDGMTALQEYQAGTHPRDVHSALRLVGGSPSDGRITLRWLSAGSLGAPESPYQVWASTNLCGGHWEVQTNALNRTPPTNQVILAVPPDSPQRFYRITLTN